jgi:hypothetical protein
VSDYTKTKAPPGANYLVNQKDQQIFSRCEPLLTPEQLRSRHLFGIPLVSQIRDPFTNKPFVMTDEILKDYITRAVNEAELETGLVIFPVQFDERHPWDVFAFNQFNYMRVEQRPVISVERLTIAMSNHSDVYVVDNNWIEVGQAYKGIINVLPVTTSVAQSGVATGSAGGAVFLSVFASRSWIPSFWRIIYTAGFKEGQIPRIVNELIGAIAAMKILSSLATTYAKQNSSSLSIDAMSQSVSTPGPQLFAVRMKELAEERKMIIQKLKKNYGTTLIVGEV